MSGSFFYTEFLGEAKLGYEEWQWPAKSAFYSLIMIEHLQDFIKTQDAFIYLFQMYWKSGEISVNVQCYDNFLILFIVMYFGSISAVTKKV